MVERVDYRLGIGGLAERLFRKRAPPDEQQGSIVSPGIAHPAGDSLRLLDTLEREHALGAVCARRCAGFRRPGRGERLRLRLSRHDPGKLEVDRGRERFEHRVVTRASHD